MVRRKHWYLSNAEMAWCMKEFLDGRSQSEIARAIGHVQISGMLMRFYARFGWWSNEFSHEIYYPKRRYLYFRQALDNYLFAGHEIVQPALVEPKSASKPDHITDEFPVWYRTGDNLYPWGVFSEARQEHAWLLRAEGLTYWQIGERLGGLSVERTRQIVNRQGRRMSWAIRRAKFEIFTPEDMAIEYFANW